MLNMKFVFERHKNIVLAVQNKKVVVFGTGSGTDVLDYYLSSTISYYVDNNASKWGNTYKDKIVFNPQCLLAETKGNVYILVASVYYDEISEQLQSYGFKEGEDFCNGLIVPNASLLSSINTTSVIYEKITKVNEEEMIRRNEDHHIRMKDTGLLHDNENPAIEAEYLDNDNKTRKLILSHLPEKGGIVLDLGVGAGGSYLALSRIFDEVHGIDVVDDYFESLTAYKTLTKGAIETLPYEDNTFDCVFSAHVMEHTYDLEKSLSEIYRVLKPGGTVLAITPHFSPDYEIAHINQLGLYNWIRTYEHHRFNVIKAYINFANVEEAHIVAQK